MLAASASGWSPLQPTSLVAGTRIALRACLAMLAGMAVLHLPAHAQSLRRPEGAYLQFGWTGENTRALTAGITWDWQRHWSVGGGDLGGYWDLSLGHWTTSGLDGGSSAVVTQLGLVPAFRWRPSEGASPWFGEVAVGVMVTTPLYQDRDKRFSTSFNFADHLAWGRNFGPQQRDEIALRLEHFSNAGIRRPNPGATFLQLRYVKRWQ